MIPCPFCAEVAHGTDAPCAKCGHDWRLLGLEIQSLHSKTLRSQCYQARDTQSGQTLIVEVMASTLCASADWLAAFELDGKILATLPTGIQRVETIAINAANGGAVVTPLAVILRAMPAGETLAARHQRKALIDRGGIVAASAAVARQLAQIHRAGLVHGNLTTASIAIKKSGEGEVGGEIVDFTPATGLMPLEMLGLQESSLDFQCPERVAGESQSGASDQYSLAISIFFAFAGRSPGEDAPTVGPTLPAHLLSVESERETWLESIDSALRPTLLRAMHRDPSMRFASMDEMATALATAREHMILLPELGEAGSHRHRQSERIQLRMAPAATASRPASRGRRRTLIALTLVGLVALIAVGALSSSGFFGDASAVAEASAEADAHIAAINTHLRVIDRNLTSMPAELVQTAITGARKELVMARATLQELEQAVARGVDAGSQPQISLARHELADMANTLAERSRCLDELAAACRAQLAANALDAKVRELLGRRERINFQEIEIAGGPGLERVHARVVTLGRQLAEIAGLEGATLRQLEDMHGEISFIEESLLSLDQRLSAIAIDFDEARERAARAFEQIGQSATAMLTDAEAIGDAEVLRQVEEWIATENIEVDAVEAEGNAAVDSRSARAVAEKVEGYAAQFGERAAVIAADRLQRERTGTVARAKERAEAVQALIDNSDMVVGRPGAGGECDAAVIALGETLTRFNAATELAAQAEIGNELIAAATAPQRCLADLFASAVSARREQLTATFAAAEGQSDSITGLIEEFATLKARADLALDPLAEIRELRSIEYGVFKALRQIKDQIDVEVKRIRGIARLAIFDQDLAGLDQQLVEVTTRMESQPVDLAATAVGLKRLRRDTEVLGVKIETEQERDAAEALRQRAVAMEQTFKELYIGGSLIASEEEIYQRAVRSLGEGREKFEKGDYSGARASLEFSLEQFAKIQK